MYLKPNGFTGAAMAAQGISDVTLVLHGQAGCAKGIAASPCMVPGGRIRFACTDIRPEDYYGSASGKLERTMANIRSKDSALKVLMSSPGVSMIGENYGKVLGEDAMVIDTDELPPSCPEGFDDCICQIASFLEPEKEKTIENGVNIVGLSIMHKDWQSFDHEIRHFLKDAGFQVISALGAGCTADEIRRSAAAAYNIVVDPAYCSRTADMYERKFGVKPVSTGRCPVGYDAIEELFTRIEEVTGVRTEHGLSMLKKSKRRAYSCIRSSSKSLAGYTFGIDAPGTSRLPLKEFLENSFGMTQCEDCPDYLFAPGDSAVLRQASGMCGKGIDIGFPSSGTDFIRKPLMGLDGVMYILDGLFNRFSRTPRREASSPGYGLS